MDFCTYFFALGIPTQAFFRAERSFKIEKYFAKNKKTVQNIFILIILLKMSAQGIHMLRKVYEKQFVHEYSACIFVRAGNPYADFVWCRDCQKSIKSTILYAYFNNLVEKLP